MSDNLSRTKRSSQAIDNFSFDEETLTKVVLPLEYDPSGATKRKVTESLATVVDEASATVTYIGKATIGTATSSALWQIKKVSTSGTVTSITWADTNDSFDNIWDNRASLSYA